MDPSPFSLRQLLEVYDAKVSGDRDAMRSILAAVYSAAFQKLIKPSEIRFAGEKEEQEEMTEEQAIGLFFALGGCTSG